MRGQRCAGACIRLHRGVHHPRRSARQAGIQLLHPPASIIPPPPPVLNLQQVADQRIGGQRLGKAALGPQEGGAAGVAVPRGQVVAQAAGSHRERGRARVGVAASRATPRAGGGRRAGELLEDAAPPQCVGRTWFRGRTWT